MTRFSAQHFLRRQSDLRRFVFRLATRAMSGTLVGVLTAALTLWIDRTAGLSLPLPASNSQLLLGSLVGAIITITVFVLWMRVVVVSLVSSQASPRVLTGYLDDGFQRNLTAWMMGGVMYLTAATLGLPLHRDTGGVPAVTSLVAVLILVTALSTVLVAMHSATKSLAMPQIVRSLADHAFAVIEAQDRPDDPTSATPPHAGTEPLRSSRMGWVQWIDHDRIMDGLPPDTVLTIDVTTAGAGLGSRRVGWHR
jgi:uncharacterized membrane protein